MPQPLKNVESAIVTIYGGRKEKDHDKIFDFEMLQLDLKMSYECFERLMF